MSSAPDPASADGSRRSGSAAAPTTAVAVWLVLTGIASVQFGAAIAKGLFDVVPPSTMVWLRVLTSAIVLLALTRPRLRGRSRRDWTTVVAYGLALGTMNWAIYHSMARIPLGLAVTIEFVGPLAVACFGFRRRRDLTWVVLAGVGVVLLGVTPGDLDPAGIAFALLAAGCWAAYILLSASVGQRFRGLDGLAVASAVAAVAMTVPAALDVVAGRADGLLDPRVLALGAGVGLLSSVIPYSCELTALRRLPPATFGILMSLEPAVATLAALVVLGELLTLGQWLAMACVVAASVGATRAATRSTGAASRSVRAAAPAPD